MKQRESKCLSTYFFVCVLRISKSYFTTWLADRSKIEMELSFDRDSMQQVLRNSNWFWIPGRKLRICFDDWFNICIYLIIVKHYFTLTDTLPRSHICIRVWSVGLHGYNVYTRDCGKRTFIVLNMIWMGSVNSTISNRLLKKKFRLCFVGDFLVCVFCRGGGGGKGEGVGLFPR